MIGQDILRVLLRGEARTNNEDYSRFAVSLCFDECGIEVPLLIAELLALV